MGEIRVRKFQPADQSLWNEFVRRSKNGIFMFEREFMDYHAHRFKDHSILIFEGEILRCVIPANESDGTVVSHGGLSHGGMLLEKEVNLAAALSFFYHSLRYLHENGFHKMTYKCAPSYLARIPSFEDQYALFLVDAKLWRRDMSAVCSANHGLQFRESRRQSVKKAADRGLAVSASENLAQFWDILKSNLSERHGVSPTHSLQEMQLLMKHFPEQIKYFEVCGEHVLGGTVIFETATCAHAQYISSTPEGKSCGALDLLFHVLITKTFSHKTYFSFGMSNEKDGRYLNAGLNRWKEGFGTKAFPLDFYEVQTSNYVLLDAYA